MAGTAQMRMRLRRGHDMRLTTISLALCLLLVAATAVGQNWADDPPDKDSARPAVAGEPTLAPTVSVELKAAAKDLAGREGLTFKQRRALGITFRNIRKEFSEMSEAGELEGKTQSVVAREIMERLVRSNPTAFADPTINFDAVMAWVEWFLSILLYLLAFI